jgi:hypothetical protein
MFDSPVFDYDLRVAGNALFNAGLTGANTFYRLPVITFADTVRDELTHPGPAPDQQPGEVPVPTVTVNRNAVASNGVAVFAEVNGQTYVNLRGMVENIAGGTVAWTPETGAVFSAPHATNGTITSIWEVSAGVFNAEVNNALGTRGARFINIDSGWFVSVDAFQTLFGRVPAIIG